ncbi:Coiled-coil domain-containing protein 24 [Bagarius yarrelli]|uniref:Coiled-coil domain-containing protein 24 n=1 Tax=Bagarius yarrelli TaxID=175774 RepID=A0A556U2X5_BAGYA|nr:Coiled-coil domain-containing protein 24 [Bagarius yarrelli]
MEPFQRQQSVWSLIKECVPESELPEIRAVLGDALIDTYKEIYSEVQMWQQIWLDVHDGKTQMPKSSLSDPPAVKELLRSELQLLLLSLRQKSVGRDEDEVMSRYSPRVVRYALGTERQRPRYSPHSFECTTPNSRPESSRSSSSSRISSHSSVEEEIEAVRHKLNISHIDEIVSHLKSLLMEECGVLKNEVQLLQESVDLEYLKQSGCMEPTLTELKKERRLIQEDLDVLNKSICTNRTADFSPSSSSKWKSKGLEEKSSSSLVSPVSPERDFLQPKPPPHNNRTAFLGKTGHTLSSSTTRFSGSSPNPARLPRLDLENSVSASLATVQLRSSNPSGSEMAFVGSLDCKRKEKAPRGHFNAASIPMIPSPPAGQRDNSRGQHVGRRLVLHQTDRPVQRFVKPLAAEVNTTHR